MNRRLPQLLSILGLLALIVALAPRSVVAAQDLIGTTSHVSVSSGGVQGNAASDSPAISADGRYVAFSSQASNLVPGDTNDRWDVFVHDLQTGRTSLVSVSSNSEQGDDMSVRPAISADGRYVAFSSAASNLVAEDSNNSGDIFVRDMVTGETSLVSRHTNGEQGNFYSSFPSISSDGRYVSFSSYASNLVDDDVVMCWGRSCEDTFVHDRATGATVLVTRHSNGTPSNYEYYSHLSSLSADGRSVVFNSDASNLIDNDANGNYADIFIHDILTGKTALVSRSTNNVQGNRESLTSFISPNGRFIAFSSEASNLIDYHDNTGTDDVFIHDRETQETQLVSKASDGTQGDDDSWHPSLSGDGRFVVFLSTARNLAEEQISNCGQTVCQDVILHDRNTGETVKIGRSIDPVPENNHYRSARISSDSRYIVFVSDNSQLVEGDVNGASDVFLFDRVTSLISLVSRSSTGIGRDLRLDLLIEDSRDDVVVNKTAGSYVDIVAELTGPQLLAPDVTLHVPNDVLGAPVLTFTRDNADSSRGYGQENQYVNLGGGQYRVGTALTQMALDNQTLFHKEVVWRFQVPDSADLGDLTVTAVAEQAGMTFIFGADEASFRIVDRGNAILVTNRERLFAVYGQGEKWAEVDGLLSEIYRAATQRSGEVFYVDRYGVDWNPTTSETAANVVVQSIDSRIEQWYTQLRANDSSAPPRYLLLVGGDEIIPFWRADDDRYACSYQADACEDAHWASGNSTYGVLWNAYDDNYFLTDNVYADIGGAVADWEKGNLEMAVGRIAGRNAAQMRYLISNGYNRTRSLLAGGVASIEGVDVDRIVAAMDSRDVSTIGGSNPDLTENNGWTAAQFADVWRTDWQMFFFGGHANPWTVASGNGQSIPNVDLADSEIDVNHPLFVSAGCNLAVPIATNADGTVKGIVYHLVDQGTAGIIGSTGISHFIRRIPERQVGGEKLTSDVLSLLLSGNSQTLPFGEALRRAKVDFNPVDPVGAKTMLEYVYYGLPWASTSIPPTSAQALNHDAGHDFQIEASPPQSVDSVTTRTYSFDVSSYNLVDLDGYTLLAMDQAENIADSEWPALPLVVHTVILPQRSTIANITLDNETAQSLGSRDLVSLLPQTTYDTSSGYMPFDGTGVYPSGNRFSYRIVEHPEFTAVEITVYLGTYNSDTRELTLYNHTELQLEYVADQPVVIKSFDLSQPVYTPGESVEASARIENVTDQPRELTGLLTVVDSNNETVVALEVDSLTVGAGQETTLAVPIPASLSHGTYSAELKLFEANVMVAQGGNTFTVEDGQITGFDVPAQAYAGEGAPIAIRFRNLGLLDAYLLANVSILDQGIEVGKLVPSAATVAPGEEGSITWSWDPTGLSSGTYTLRPVVMAGNMSYFAPDAQIEVISDGPDITMFSPSSGPIGTLVTISGTNLINTTSVTFNGMPAVAVNIVSATEITAIVPAGATTGKIAVTTPGGTATSAADFTVIPPPTIGGFSPTSGPVGMSVILTGTAFTGTTAVTFNGVNASLFTVNSATQITAVVPAGATTGKIFVTTPGGTATSAADFTVTTAPPFPDVFYLSPSANVTIGGIAAQGADVLRYTRSTNSWTMVFDGSNHGLTKNVSAFTFLDDGSLLFVLAANQTIAGLGAVTPYDVVKFTPNTSGGFPLDTGTYSWYAQLKPKGLTTAGEKIDAIDVVDNRLLLSTGGAASVPKPGGGVLKPADEDVFVYNLGTGAFEITLLIDGSKMPGMAVEDITGIWDDPQSSDYYITVVGAFNLGGVKGNDKSIVRLTPNGGATVYSPSLVSWLAAGATLPTGFKIDGIEIAR